MFGRTGAQKKGRHEPQLRRNGNSATFSACATVGVPSKMSGNSPLPRHIH